MKSLFLAVLLFSSIGYSKTLIVSDIDDTIKASHVRYKVDSTANALITTLAFKGMKETYEEVLKNADAEIIYVTNAPDIVMSDSHTTFIKKNKFPKGKIFFRKGNAATHKYETIKNYLLENPVVDRLILVGDNGERDIQYYHKIAQEFKERLTTINTYIRIVYSEPYKVKPLEEGQKGFVSPLELLADLTVNYFIATETYYEVAEKLAEAVLEAEKTDTKNPQYFPSWLTCKNFEPGSYEGLMTPIIEKGFEKVRSICQQSTQVQLN